MCIRDSIKEVSPGKFKVNFKRWNGRRFVNTPIMVDADLLTNDDGSPYGAGTGREGAPRELWAALVEKAYFEFSQKYGIYGGYEAFDDEAYGGRLPGRKKCPTMPDITGIEEPDPELNDVKYFEAITKTQQALQEAIDALADLDEDSADDAFGDQAGEILDLSDRKRAALRRQLKKKMTTLKKRVLDARKRKLRSNPDEGGVSQFAFQVFFGTEAESDDDFADGDIDEDTLFSRIKRNLKKGACITAGSLASDPPEGALPVIPDAPDFLRIRRPSLPAFVRAKDPKKAVSYTHLTLPTKCWG